MTSEADRIIGLYRRHAQKWIALRQGRFIERSWLDRFSETLPQTATVLDLGCGAGVPIASYLLANGYDVTGIDSSPELIDAAQARFADGHWQVSDMRGLDLNAQFDGLLGWHSMFHLTPDDQRNLFSVFRRHAAKGATLMFTSGTQAGETLGVFEGEPLYHAGLDAQEYRSLLDASGFEVIDHVVEDPDCGGATIWLARFSGD